MTDTSAPLTHRSRLAAALAAAGLLFSPLLIASAGAQTTLPPPAYGNADARQDRIEELQTQLTEATAENERLQFELQQAQREITRLRAMVGELAGVNQDLQTGPPQPATPGTPAPDASGLSGAQQRAQGTLGTMPANTPVPRPDPDAAYAVAREHLVNGRYAEAENAFSQFLEQNPRHIQTADARFWLGYAQLARNSFQDAAAAFVQYLQSTPNGPRAPEAQVRLGMALNGMGQTRQACAAYAALARQYPNASTEVRALATREARVARCSG
ncbi:MAG: tol-pal system protein YbgF [Hyphomonadaceae bacterium]|nr:tol-pal system protein YbgF [Hyphomonadaceae bacterium]